MKTILVCAVGAMLVTVAVVFWFKCYSPMAVKYQAEMERSNRLIEQRNKESEDRTKAVIDYVNDRGPKPK